MDNKTYGSPRDITRLVIGLLFGSGITGIAIGMIQGAPDARPWAMAIFVLSLVAAGLVFWWGERTIERQDEKGLSKLSAAYSRILSVLGQYVSGNASNQPDALAELVEKMEEELKHPLGEGEDAAWVKAFKDGSKSVVESWKELIVTESTEARVPDGATPETEDAGIPMEVGL